VFSRFGITLGMYEILMHISNHVDTTTKIADKLQITLASITHKTKPMEDKGYIKRVVNGQDKRVWCFSLTEKGQNLLDTICEVNEKITVPLYAQFSIEHKRRVLAFLEATEEHMRYILQNRALLTEFVDKLTEQAETGYRKQKNKVQPQYNHKGGPSQVSSIKWEFPSDYHSRSLDVLETVLSQVNAYKAWQVFDPGREYPVDARYAALPALTKKDIRQHFPGGLLPRNRDINSGLASGEIELVETSGTVDRITNVWNQKWWDASERASWKLNSYASKIATGDHPEAILANPLNVGFVSDNLELPMEKRRLSRFLYLNEKTVPSSWSSEHMDRMIKELEIFKPAVFEANPSLLAKLCRYIAARKRAVFQPGLIVLTYEYPTKFHYQQIRQVFGVPIVSSYGTTETGYVFMQCEEGKFHQNSEFCRVDFQPLKPEHGGPILGRILVTTFNNPWYYMVRFDVGDLVRIDETGKCSCGRGSGLILAAIEGRIASVTLTCRGRLVSSRELDDSLSVLDGIEEYRLEQVSGDAYNLDVVSQRLDKDRLSQEASAILKRLYGREATVSVNYKTSISPEVSGKYSISKALFPIELERYLDERYLPK
jgi:phenylacetate-coenzyme A ligase PaaK-like adenylate-forming protein/DNA-binding MarR family transcriptional regulator